MKIKVAISIVLTFIISLCGFITWNHFNPRYVVVPESYNKDQFNRDYAIMFDNSKVKYENIKKFNDVRTILKKQFYKDVDENMMIEGAVAGMADSLKDPYTVYFTKEQMKIFTEKAEGMYVGIGVSIAMDNNGLLSIIQAFDGSPAKEVGIIQGDKIIKVDDKDVTGMRDEEMIISLIKGEENTKVKVTVYRQTLGKAIDFDITRKRIKVNNIKSEIIDGDIGYIKLLMFDGEISKFFNEHLQKLLSKGIKELIIDLRDNPGGDYNEVVAIADRLLPKGLIVYTEDKNGVKEVRNSDDLELKLPIAVLINENSASASEVLAGALKDHKKGILVGDKSFGKGLVQQVETLSDGSGIKITIARYFTPSGVCIQGIGILPDVQVSVNEKFKNQPVSVIPENEDDQLKKAISVFKRKTN